MKKSELFTAILDEVAEVCELRKEAILAGSKLQSVVDARILAVQYMRRHGLSSDDIPNLPDMELPSPSAFDQVKQGASSIVGWLSSHREDVSNGIAFIQSLRRPATPVVDNPAIPPIPKI